MPLTITCFVRERLRRGVRERGLCRLHNDNELSHLSGMLFTFCQQLDNTHNALLRPMQVEPYCFRFILAWPVAGLIGKEACEWKIFHSPFTL